MATATVRHLRYDFPAILKRLEEGEEVAITRRGKPVGTLVPVESNGPRVVRWPDLSQRLRAIHGKRIFNPSASILKQRKNER